MTDYGLQPEAGPPVQIILVHYKGSLQVLGCCNPDLYERDEFVAIRNVSHQPQDIRGWTLKNESRGYPVFTFPEYFPCLPYAIDPEFGKEQSLAGGYYSYKENTPSTLLSRFSPVPKATVAQTGVIDWAACSQLTPLDPAPMKPMEGQQGLPALCILYPGQTVLVFTDEVHCKYGGFSFNSGQGNVWSNQQPETAVLYNASGEEVSRRSYLLPR